ncbi:MAG TPA: NAD(P)-dependent oxidoreductase [Chitinophagaceae bacterium]|nr:NAD(P)-dependent oxidoreductase [Chitinophagaceae bacterium]
MKQVVIAAPISETFQRKLLEQSLQLQKVNHLAAIQDHENIIGIVTSNKLALKADALRLFPNLTWIARLGSGMEIIDTSYCDANQIVYVSSPAGIANSVAEHMTAMLLNLLHHIPRAAQEIKQGQWNREANRGNEIENLRIGIIGYGHTGMAFAQKMRAFTPFVMAYDKYKQNFSDAYVREVSLEDLQDQVDILSFHVPLTAETTHYYNSDFLHRMKKSHYVLNGSRGKVASTPCLLEGLQSGKILGAALDVLEEEAHMPQLLHTPGNFVEQLQAYNTLITPHIAGYSFNAIEKMSAELLAGLQAKQLI